MGVGAAIPIGASQIEIAKRAINKHRFSAFMVATGTVSSDMFYGFIALFGAGQFLRGKVVIAIFEFAATLILWVLSYITFRTARKQKVLGLNDNSVKSKKWSFITGFSLAITNPMMIIWWLIGFRVIKNFNLIPNISNTVLLFFLISGGLGLISYLFFFIELISKLKKFLTAKKMRRFYYAMAGILLMLSFYFLFHALKTLLT
jgi:threonine/homoserine/homoserine lactone efflux protein